MSVPAWLTLRVGLWIAGAAGVVAVIWFVVIAPTLAERRNKEAVVAVTQKAAESTQKGAAQAVETNAQTEKRIVVVQERERVRTPRVRDAADPYGEFLAGMCESRLYKDDPQCGGKRGTGGGDRGSR